MELDVWYETEDGRDLCFTHAVKRALTGEKLKTKVDALNGTWAPFCKDCLEDE